MSNQHKNNSFREIKTKQKLNCYSTNIVFNSTLQCNHKYSNWASKASKTLSASLCLLMILNAFTKVFTRCSFGLDGRHSLYHSSRMLELFLVLVNFFSPTLSTLANSRHSSVDSLLLSLLRDFHQRTGIVP